MSKLIATIVVIVGLTAGLWLWVGPDRVQAWNRVVHEDVISAVDRRLGEIRVGRAALQQRMDRLAEGVDRLREGHVMTQVKAERVGERLAGTEELQHRAERALGRVRDLVAAGSPTTLGGKTLSTEEVDRLGRGLITAVETVRAKRDALEQAKRILDTSASRLGTRVEESRTTLASLRNQLEVLDAKADSLLVLRDAAEAADAIDGSLAEQFGSVQADIDALYVKVESGLRIEEDRWKSDPMTGGPNVDRLIRELDHGEATVRRIDELLGRIEGPAAAPTPGGG